MEVYWVEQSEADVPETNGWLGANELHRMHALRFLKRRMEWRLGRWTAKCAVVFYEGFPTGPDTFAKIEIRSTPSGSPAVFVLDRAADLTISLSHRSGRAICALAGAGVKLGCDLEVIEPHSQAFIEDYLTQEEQLRVAQASANDCPRLVTLFWSAKESFLKAMGVGLRLDTRSVIVRLAETHPVSRWIPLTAQSSAGGRFQGWWRQDRAWLQTLIAAPSPNQPIQLPLPVLDRLTRVGSWEIRN